MISCDCKEPNQVITNEYIVCRNCGIVIDQIYENNLSFEKVAHFSNVVLRNIHPSINRELSKLSAFIEMSFETRMDIIDRANRIAGSSINYTMATKYAFLEVFPQVPVELTPKNIKKIDKFYSTITECGEQCNTICKNSYKNKVLLKQIKQIKILIKNGKKKGLTIDDVLKKAKFSKQTYYKYRNLKFEHIAKKYESKTISESIGKFILKGNESANKLSSIIYAKFGIHIHPQAISRFRRKMKNS